MIQLTRLLLIAIFSLSIKSAIAQTGKMQLKIPFGHNNDINSIDFSKDGKLIVTAGGDDQLIIWDAKTAKEIKNIYFESSLKAAWFCNDPNMVLTAEMQSMFSPLQFSLWDINSQKRIRTFSFTGKINCSIADGEDLLLIPSFIENPTNKNAGQKFIQEENAEYCAVFDLQKNKLIAKFKTGIFERDEEIGFSKSGNNYFIVAQRGKILPDKSATKNAIDVWSLKDETNPLLTINTEKRISDISAGNGGHFASLCYKDNKIQIWDIKKNNSIGRIPFDSLTVKEMIFSRTGDSLFYVTSKKREAYVINIWDTRQGKNVLTIQLDKTKHGLTNFKPDPSWRYFTYNDGSKPSLMNFNGGEPLALGSKVQKTSEICFSTDGRYFFERLPPLLMGDTLNNPIMSKVNDQMKKLNDLVPIRQIQLWDLQTGRELVAFWNGTNVLLNNVPIGTMKKPLTATNIFNVADDGAIDDFGAKMVKWARNPYEEKSRDDKAASDMRDLATAVSEKKSKVKLFINKINHDTIRFIRLTNREWIFINKDGYYKCSKKGVPNLYYVTAENKIISFEQLDLKFNRPDLLLKSFGSPDSALIKAYRKSYYNRLERNGIEANTFEKELNVPQCDITNAGNLNYTQLKEFVTLNIHAVPQKSILQNLHVWINGIPVYGRNGLMIRKTKTAFDTTIAIHLSTGKNKIEASVIAANGLESYRMPVFLQYTPAVIDTPKTWIIGIGVKDYADPLHNTLKYPVKDIRDFIKIFNLPGRKATIDTLFNEDFTIQKLDSIKKKLLKTGINDKVLLIYSGHGVLGNDNNFYLPASPMTAEDFQNPEKLSIRYDLLENLLDGIPARNRLIFIDACHSGIYDPNAETVLDSTTTSEIINEVFADVGKGIGCTTIASSGGSTQSLESEEYKHGHLINGLLYALRNYSTIKVEELKDYILKIVPVFSKQAQQPEIRNENRDDNFTVW